MGVLSWLFGPNPWKEQQVKPARGTRGIHKHAWGNARSRVDAGRKIGQIREDCAYGCGATRDTDVRDLHERGPRCS